MRTLEQLRQARVDAAARAEGLFTTAGNANRELSEQEQTDIDAALAECDSLDAEITRRERFDATAQRVNAPQPRIVQPAPIAHATTTPGAPAIIGRASTARAVAGNLGFQSMGDFALSVRNSGIQGAQIDPRLLAAAPSSLGNEGTPADGGYLVPPDYRQDLMRFITGEESLIPRTDNWQTRLNSLNVPIDVTTPWQTSGGIQVAWLDEGGLKPQSKAVFDTQTVKLNKIAAIVPVTDELLEDAPAMDGYLRSKVPEKLTWAVNAAILGGSGTGQPLGIWNSGAKITVPRVANQILATPILYENIQAMWAALHTPVRSRSIWVANPSLETYFGSMTLGDGKFPVFLPPGGISGQPYATLFGRPIFYTEAAAAVGTEGDLTLWDPKNYLSVTKMGNPGIRTDVSMHLWFDYDVTAYRFVFRVGGKPWWKVPATMPDGSTHRSTIVTLASRPVSNS